MNLRSILYQSTAVTLLASVMAAAGAQEGIAPNGNYSAVGVSLFRTNYAADKCLFGDCHPGYGGLGINLSYQAIPNLIIGLRTMGGQDSMANTTIKESQGGLYLGFVMGVGESLDIGAIINPLTKRIENCLGSLCAAAEENGSNLEFFGKWWLDDAKTFHLGLNLDSYQYANGSTNPGAVTRYQSTALSIGYLLAEHHEISWQGSRLKDVNGNEVSATGSLAYTYLF